MNRGAVSVITPTFKCKPPTLDRIASREHRVLQRGQVDAVA